MYKIIKFDLVNFTPAEEAYKSGLEDKEYSGLLSVDSHYSKIISPSKLSHVSSSHVHTGILEPTEASQSTSGSEYSDECTDEGIQS